MAHKSKIGRALGFSVLVVGLIIFGSSACKKAAEETGVPAQGAEAAAPGPQGTVLQEGVNDVGGTVKSALGKYFYISQLPGFDIVANGPIEGGDATALLGKDVKMKVVFNRESPSLLVAQSIDIQEGQALKNVFNKADAAIPGDYFAQKNRSDYPRLNITAINKSADWEGKGKGKVYGKLIPGGQGNEISILDSAGKEIAKVIVDNISEFANYDVKKLRLFDTFWFYLNIKESVDPKLRAKNKEIFHADVVFAGLY